MNSSRRHVLFPLLLATLLATTASASDDPTSSAPEEGAGIVAGTALTSVFAPAFCMDARGGSSANGTAIQIYQCNGTAAQQWTYTNQTLQVLGKCLDATNVSSAPGTLLQIWDCTGGWNQRWVRAANNAWQLAGTNSCVDITAWNAVNWAQLELWTCTGNTNQGWTMASAPSSSGGSGKYNNLIWSDEFNGTGQADTTKWNYEVNCSGGGNAEWECYTSSPQNIFLDGGGNLVLRVIKQSYRVGGYTSGRINTSGKGDWTYGRFEARIKVPAGQGFWPAFWMLPTDNIYGGWPTSGELDIMEVLGGAPSTLYGTAHFGAVTPYTQSGGTNSSANFSAGYHIYTLERDPTQVRWYIDNQLYYTINASQQNWWVNSQYQNGGPSNGAKWPFNERYHVILNLAMGGNWPGNPDPNISQGDLVVDYVRVYQ